MLPSRPPEQYKKQGPMILVIRAQAGPDRGEKKTGAEAGVGRGPLARLPKILERVWG